ncbi:MAG: right-handed parallel beta-helix repeat-containing protein [Phycisphaerales bacterium]|nr:right-handed parallel beta-helix repeat-containing protein [Phycisphaerales bacterium]
MTEINLQNQISNLRCTRRRWVRGVSPAATVLALIGAVVSPTLAGPLTPPPGPVTSTPGAEARIAINATNTPGDATAKFIITQPGSYYLTGNIDVSAVTNTSGIRIAANDVTVDLNGFIIKGTSGNTQPLILVAGSGIGTNKGNVTIRNGTVRDGGSDGINSLTNAAETVRLYDIVSRNNLGSGFQLTNRSFVQNCVAQNNNSLGFNATSASNCTFLDCTADANANTGLAAGNAANVRNCLSTANGAFGITVGPSSAVASCVVRGNFGTEIVSGNACTITNCTADNFGTSGSGLVLGDNCAITNCTAVGGSGSVGFSAGNGCSFTSCSASGGGGGFLSSTRSTFAGCTASNSTGNGFSVGSGSTITGCSASTNSGFGILATNGSIVSNCSVYLNGSDGIRVSNGATVLNSTARSNTGVGIFCTGADNRIEGNSVSSNGGGGISVPGGCIVVRNYAAGQGANDYVVAGNNAFGQILDVSAAATTITTSNSFANFKF